MPSKRVLPPVESCLGVIPSQAAKCRTLISLVEIRQAFRPLEGDRIRCQAGQRRCCNQPDARRARQPLAGGVVAMKGAEFLFHGAKLQVHLFDHKQEAAKDTPRDVRQTRGWSVLNETSQIAHFTNALARNETDCVGRDQTSIAADSARWARPSSNSVAIGQQDAH
jgi:hypothetical protein